MIVLDWQSVNQTHFDFLVRVFLTKKLDIQIRISEEGELRSNHRVMSPF